MKKPFTKDDHIRSLLKRVQTAKAEITEKGDKAPSEIKNPTAEQIYAELSESVCTLYFYKITDGRSRKMRCTLNQSLFEGKYASSRTLKSAILANFSSGKHGKEGLVPVWDLDASEWRSFYVDRVFRLIRNENTDVE
jgi:hypothetical protein